MTTDNLPLSTTHPCHVPGCDTGSVVDHQDHPDPITAARDALFAGAPEQWMKEATQTQLDKLAARLPSSR